MTDHEDREQIVEALAQLAAALDTRDWDTVAAAFASDAHAYGQSGVNSILAVIQAHLGGCGPSQHLLGNHRIIVSGGTARSLTYARVYHCGAGEMAGSFFECLGEYEDGWVRSTDGWRISHRVFDMRVQVGNFGVLRPA
jgi:hypothetical protein